MSERTQRDEHLAASLLAGSDPGLSVPPFSSLRQRSAPATRRVTSWIVRLATAGVILVLAIALGSGLAMFRSAVRPTEVGTQPAGGGALAAARCLAESAAVTRWGSVQGVAGAFIAPASDVADWQETRDASRGARPQSQFRSYGTEQMLVCFYDGDFNSFPGRANRLPFDRIVIIFDATGAPILDSVGPRDYLKVERPGPRP